MRLFFTAVLIMAAGGNLLAQTLQADSFGTVNSVYDEQNPIISSDGHTLFFTISNHPENIGGKKDPGDIWFSRLVGSSWSAPVHAGALLNDKAYNAVAGVSSSGSQLYLHGHYDPSGERAKTQGISVSTNNGSGWSRPTNITIPYYMNKSGLLCGTVAMDGSVYVFSADTYGTYGVDDLYVSFNRDGKWTEPKNLGPVINTQFQELSPSLSPDGMTLYFSTNGLKGYGSFDIYSATRLDDSWMNWTTPKNLGSEINTAGRELFYRPGIEPLTAIYTTTFNSDRYGNLAFYRPKESSAVANNDPIVRLPNPRLDSVIEIAEVRHDSVNSEASNSGRIRVFGKVTNAKTGEVISASISFASPGKPDEIATSTSSGYTISVPSTEDYAVAIEAKGFISALENLNLNTLEKKDLEMDFKLQPVAVGITVNLKNVLFVQAKTDILPDSYPELDLVVHFLKTNPTVKIELSGHTDNRGVHNDNVKLSQQRVDKVKAYLVSKGIDAKRISGKGYGGTKPIASNDTEESRRMNRRVEFTIKRS